MSTETEFMPIRQAARSVHKAREYVKRLVDEGRVRARVIGRTKGGDPWLSVHLEELRQAIADDTIYVPPGVTMRAAKQNGRRRPSVTHPMAARI